MHLGSLESTQEARVALGYRLVQLLRIFRALQTCRVHPWLDIRTLSMDKFLSVLDYLFLSGCIKRRQVNLIQECINKFMKNCFIRLFCLNLSSSQEAQHLGCIKWWQEPAGECSNHTTKLGVNYLSEEGEGKRKKVAPPLSDTFFHIFWPSHLWQITSKFQPLQEASFCSQSGKMGIHCITIK